MARGIISSGLPHVISRKLNAAVCCNTEIYIKKFKLSGYKKYDNDFIFSVSYYYFSQCITDKSAKDSLQSLEIIT